MALGVDPASTGIYPGGKGGRCVGLTTLPSSCASCHETSGTLNLLELSGPVQGLLYLFRYQIVNDNFGKMATAAWLW